MRRIVGAVALVVFVGGCGTSGTADRATSTTSEDRTTTTTSTTTSTSTTTTTTTTTAPPTTAPPTTTPPPPTTVAPPPNDAGINDCGDDSEDALCRFMDALQAQRPDGLADVEREVYTSMQAQGLAGLSWSLDSCELTGDVTVSCYVRLQAPDPNVSNLYTVFVAPQNVTETPDGVMPNSADPGYAVVGFE